jgi:hypothetical protein
MYYLGLTREQSVWSHANGHPLGSFMSWAEGYESLKVASNS